MFNKFYYYTWNIGFVNKSIGEVVLSHESIVHVDWVKHHYRDRFFADPFILSFNENTILLLVEDYPYYNKKGVISLLTIDRNDYSLMSRKVILSKPYHMSYPFIQRNEDGSVRWIAPEASMSGNLYRYTMDSDTNQLINAEVLIKEPLVDSTIVQYAGRYWLFCTKKGDTSNENLYIYYSDTQEGEWRPHKSNPVVNDASYARPAGSIVKIGGCLYRVIQNCKNHYGESIIISKIDVLTECEFKESYVKEIRAQKDRFSHSFHTINGLGDICVVDGLCREFAPLRRIWFELRNLINQLCRK